MQQYLLLQNGLAQIEYRQRQGQEYDGAEGTDPVLLCPAQQQVELLQPMPDQGGDYEEQRHAEHHVDGLEPGHGPAAFSVPHQPGDQLIEAERQLPAMTLHHQAQLCLRCRHGGQDPRRLMALAYGQYEGITPERVEGGSEQPQQQGGQFGFVFLIAPQHIDGAHLCHTHLGQVGSCLWCANSGPAL